MSKKDRKKGLTEDWQGLFFHLRVGGEGKGKGKRKKSSLLPCECWLNGWIYLIYSQDFAGNGRDEVFGENSSGEGKVRKPPPSFTALIQHIPRLRRQQGNCDRIPANQSFEDKVRES